MFGMETTSDITAQKPLKAVLGIADEQTVERKTELGAKIRMRVAEMSDFA